MRRFLTWLAAFLVGYLALGVIMGEFGPEDDVELSSSDLESYGVPPVKAEYLAGRFNFFFDSLRRTEGGQAFQDSLLDGSQQEAFQAGRRMGMMGLARLGHPEVQEFAAFQDKVLANATTRECARVARGQADTELSLRLMATVDTTEIRPVFGLLLDGVVAEVSSDEPRPDYSQDRIDAAWSAFLDQMPPADQKRFASTWQAGEAAPDRDWCWAERTLWKILADLPPKHGEVIYAQLATFAPESAD